MTTMRVVPMAPGEFGVEVTEGHEVTGHKVRLPPAFLDDLLLTGVDEEQIVRETFDFLLEREPATSILAAPLDVFLVRKLGVPGHEELAMGAIASGGTRVLNRPVIERLGVSLDDVEAVARSEAAILRHREQTYRRDRRPAPVEDATVIVVDDGLATGASMRAALQALRAREPAAIIVAVPVGSPETCRALRAEADDVLCLRMPDRFLAVGQAYDNFSPTTDDEVRAVLDAVASGNN